MFALVPSPVVALNRAVAVVFDTDRQRGLAAVEELRADKTIANHYLFASVRDDLLVRLGRPIEGVRVSGAWPNRRRTHERALMLGRTKKVEGDVNSDGARPTRS